MYRCVVFGVLLAVANAQGWGYGIRPAYNYGFGGGAGFAPSAFGFNPMGGYAAPAAAVNRGYTLTSTIDGAGNAVGSRRQFGPYLGFNPPRVPGLKSCVCYNGGRCSERLVTVNGDQPPCTCPRGFGGEKCEIAEGGRNIALSGSKAPHNLFGCNDIPMQDGTVLQNDCMLQLDRVRNERLFHYPHKRYNNYYVQCTEHGRCFTKTCKTWEDFNPQTMGCMPCARHGSEGCSPQWNSVRAVSMRPTGPYLGNVAPAVRPAPAAVATVGAVRPPIAAVGAVRPPIGALPFNG